MALAGAQDTNKDEVDYTKYDGCSTIAQLFKQRCDLLGDKTAHREKTFGIWRSYSWTDYYQRAKTIGLALLELGLQQGDVVSILSEDNKEWLYIDMAATCLGAIPSGVYTTDSASQLQYLVNDSASTFLFVENDEQLDKYLEVAESLPTLKRVIVLERDGLRGFEHEKVLFLDQLYNMGQQLAPKMGDQFERAIDAVQPDDVRMLIYTSGTTGKPKGALITHSNIIFQLNSLYQLLEAKPTDDALCFLPLCHVVERLFAVESQLAVGLTVNFAESPDTVFENLQEISPQTFFAVPRVWEKIFSRLDIMRKEATAFGRWVFDLAIGVGARRADHLLHDRGVPFMLKMVYWVCDLLVLSNLRRMIGLNRIRRASSGAAPISPELLKWYWSIGVPLLEGYGQTECAGVATFNSFGAHQVGTVGRVMPGAEIRLAQDGEIQLNGKHIFKGYLGKPEKTEETLTDDGWLKTGDIGDIDERGYVSITGRKKDIIITAGGKNITPAEIESALKFSVYISDAVVIGDRRKYLTALIMIDQENVEHYAQREQVPFNDFASLCQAEAVIALIQEQVDKVNQQFARVEQVKAFRLIDQLLTAEDEELTPTMKLKRGFVEKKHAALIESMYGRGE